MTITQCKSLLDLRLHLTMLYLGTGWDVGVKWAKVNQPPWLHQLAIMSIGCVRQFTFFSSASLPYVNQHSTIVNLFWLLAFDHIFCCHFFPNFNFHTIHPPYSPNDLNLSSTYKLTTNPLLTLAKKYLLLVKPIMLLG